MDVQLISNAAIALESATLQGMQKPLAQAVQPLPMQLPAVAPPASDAASALFAGTLAPAEVAQVAALLEPPQTAGVTERITALTSDTALALQVGDNARALSNITEIAALNPHAVEPLRTDAVLDPIRPEVDQLVNRLTTVAKMNAEGWLAQADNILASPQQPSIPDAPAMPDRLSAPAQPATTVVSPPNPSTSLANPSLPPAAEPAAPLAPAAPPSPQTIARITELTHDTAQALREGDRTRAFANVKEIAALDPNSLESLRTDRVFTSMRPEFEHLLTRVAAVTPTINPAVAATPAASTPESAESIAPLLTSLVKPETLLHVARHLFDAGGYANYVRSADLAQSIANPLIYSPILEQYAAAVAPKPLDASIRLGEDDLLSKVAKLGAAGKSLAALGAAAAPRLQNLWRCAPLLVLLLTWLCAGVIAGSASIVLRALWPDTWPASLIDFGFNVWATGFLGLVCFGFYARTRNIRTIGPRMSRPRSPVRHVRLVP